VMRVCENRRRIFSGIGVLVAGEPCVARAGRNKMRILIFCKYRVVLSKRKIRPQFWLGWGPRPAPQKIGFYVFP